ncbi:hypothetical protein ACFLQ2_04420 [archaeon]
MAIHKLMDHRSITPAHHELVKSLTPRDARNMLGVVNSSTALKHENMKALFLGSTVEMERYNKNGGKAKAFEGGAIRVMPEYFGEMDTSKNKQRAIQKFLRGVLHLSRGDLFESAKISYINGEGELIENIDVGGTGSIPEDIMALTRIHVETPKNRILTQVIKDYQKEVYGR